MTAPRALPLRPAAEGVRIALRVTPNAARDAIEGIEERPGAGAQLRIRVRAQPDRGKANAAVIALLAKAWSMPRSAFSILAGETARDKILLVSGEPETLATALTHWFGAHLP